MSAQKSPVRAISLLVVLVASITAGCGGGSGTERTENTLPSIQLNDGEVLGNGNSIINIPASDDTGIASVSATLLRQGNLPACEGLIDRTLTADSLLEACLADQPTCSVEFIPSPSAVGVYPPPLYAPIGLEYEIKLIDRDGAITDPIRSTFCFDVGINTPPTATADTYQLVFPGTIQTDGVIYDARCEKQPGSDGVLFNDDDDEHITNTCLRAELVDPPQFASNLATFSNTFNANGGFRYEGLTNAPSTDRFTYRVTDGVNPLSAPITVDIIYSGNNQPPIAVDDEYTVQENSEAQALSVLTNDTDPDGLPLTVLQVNNGPVNGIARIRNGVIIEYRPNADFSGNDSFNYVVSDSAGVTATATVRIEVTAVNTPPMANNDQISTVSNDPVSINVTANDTDSNGDTLTVTAVSNPINGTASTLPDGQVQYTSDINFAGTDTFEYQIDDGNGGTASAVVTVTVQAANQPPVAVADRVATEQNEPVTIAPLANDTDPEGDTITVSNLTNPANGSATVDNDEVLYTPDADFTGTDNFAYEISDGNGGTDTATITVNVTGVDAPANQPPVAEDDLATTTQNTGVSIELLGNDADPDSDVITVSSITSPSNGTATLQASGQVLYTPAEDFSGTDSFDYEITDGNGGTDNATVTIAVTEDGTPVNQPPIAVDDTLTTELNDPVRFRPIDNDSDPEGDSVDLVSITQPQNGAARINGNSNRIIYSPNTGFIGTDSFEYTIEDSEGATATGSVTVTVVAL
ncbi:MAG: Ig-like domain-containing protein [Pseudomonadota bacterium]